MSFEVQSDRQRLRALSHPVRLRVLSLLTGDTMSSTELARELDMSQAAVSFHVRRLAEAGFLELAETRSVRGGQEKRYRLAPGGGVHEQADMAATASAVAAEVQRRLLTAKPATWDLFGDADVWVDEQVWVRCVRAVADAMTELHQAAVPNGSPGAIHVSATTLLFQNGGAGSKRAGKPSRSRGRDAGG